MFTPAVAALLLAACVVDAAPPSTCALYFNFTHTERSDTWIGEASDEGVLHARANLGKHDDPQGQLTISPDGSSFAFTTNDEATKKEHFGCCDRKSIIEVNIKTGKSVTASLHRKDGVDGVKCGLWGCGFLEIGGLDVNSMKTIAWVEHELPPAPPATSPTAPRPRARRARKLRKENDHIGDALVEFDLKTGNASIIRPFFIDADNQTGPAMTSGGTCFDDTLKHMWFACNPDASDFNTEGVCGIPASPAQGNAPVTAHVWANKKYTITDVQYSKPLASVVALAQNIADDDKLTSTQVYQMDPTTKSKNWPMLVDLGKSVGSLHQTTISADGQYLMVLLQVDMADYPVQHLVTVDLVAKKEVKRVVLKDNGLHGYAILSVLAC